MTAILRLAMAGLVCCSLFNASARAENQELTVAKQFGLGYLQLMLMEDRNLVEKQAKAAGLGDIKVTWATFRSSDVMNDALISGTVDFVCLGVPGLATIWARTRDRLGVRAASGLNLLPLFLNTRNPAVKTLADFTEQDRIAVPAVKVSMQAIILQMAAAQAFGKTNFAKLDPLTVSMAHPDATGAMVAGRSEVTANFSSPPFQFRQLQTPGIRQVLNSTEVLGGPISFNVVAATDRFRTANPRLYASFLAALDEATALINADKRAAAEAYLRLSGDRSPIDDIMAMMNDPAIEFTTVPYNLFKMVDFMYETGGIKTKPASWRDLFFPNVVEMRER
jgi:NitT/TauT family transport system substrate-binding protein